MGSASCCCSLLLVLLRGPVAPKQILNRPQNSTLELFFFGCCLSLACIVGPCRDSDIDKQGSRPSSII